MFTESTISATTFLSFVPTFSLTNSPRASCCTLRFILSTGSRIEPQMKDLASKLRTMAVMLLIHTKHKDIQFLLEVGIVKFMERIEVLLSIYIVLQVHPVCGVHFGFGNNEVIFFERFNIGIYHLGHLGHGG